MKLFKFATGAFFASCGLLLGGCTEDITPPNIDTPINEEVQNIISKMTRGEESRTLIFADGSLFNNDARTNFQWTEIDLETLFGFSFSLPGEIHITEGKTWREYRMHNITNPNPLLMSWIAYCKVTGFSKELFIVADTQYDEQEKKLTIDGRNYRVEEYTENLITLAYESDYSYHDSKGICETGTQREIIKYSVNSLSLDNKENIMYFNSERELNKCLIDMIRAEFGNEFDLNDYLAPNIILDEPMVNLDEIEKQLLGK